MLFECRSAAPATAAVIRGSGRAIRQWSLSLAFGFALLLAGAHTARAADSATSKVSDSTSIQIITRSAGVDPPVVRYTTTPIATTGLISGDATTSTGTHQRAERNAKKKVKKHTKAKHSKGKRKRAKNPARKHRRPAVVSVPQGGTWVDLGWPAAAVLIALAAWQQPRAFAFRALRRTSRLSAPLVCTAVVLGLLIYGNYHTLNPLALTLAACTVLALLWRMRQVFVGSGELLDRMTVASLTDELTGLGNRRALAEDLTQALVQHASGFDTAGRAFLIYDLNGFKCYNDSFGHPAGDALLAKLGGCLQQAVAGHGRAYRLGGGEFCVLLANDGLLQANITAATGALTEIGENFEVTAAYGTALIPEDGDTVSDIMRRADQLMYASKAKGRPAVGQQMRDVLLRALFERSIDLGEHNDNVASLAAAVAKRMGLDAERVDEVVRAAELHDVGKVAIPDSILLKPGSLDDAEWAQMRTHTLVGERILAAAPALRPVGRLVRSSHERWDGGGYPDRLAGEEIPLGARIVTACDAFDAMVSDRPYRKGMSYEQAIAELRDCAGSQFDPAVVHAICGVLADQPELASRVSQKRLSARPNG